MLRNILLTIGKLWRRMPWYVILLLFAVPFLIRNLLLPLVGDDFSYAFIWDGEHWGNLMDNIGPREPINSLYDILVSQWSHYFTWGGRTPSMIFIQLFAWIGKVWFDLANTAVFVLLMLVLYWLAVGKIESPAHHKGAFLWVLLCMLFGVLDYPTTMLWMTGACVYLWTGLWECLFLLPFVNEELRVKSEEFPAGVPVGEGMAVANSSLFTLHSSLLMAPLGLMAGWSEEAGSLITVMLTTFFLIEAWQQKQLKRWMVVGYVFLLIGCGLLILSPGSLNRMDLMLELAPEYVLPPEKFFSVEMFWDNFTEGFLPILIWESFLFIPIVLFFRGERFLDKPSGKAEREVRGKRIVGKRIFAFTAGGIMVLVVMMIVPEFALRTGFHSTMFLTVGSAAAFKEIAPWLKQSLVATPIRRITSITIGTLLILYGLFILVGAFYIESSYRQQFDERLDYVMQHRDQKQLVVPAFQIPNGLDHYIGPRSLVEDHLIYAADIEAKPTDNRSLMYALYYDLPPICIDRQVDWNKRNGE